MKKFLSLFSFMLAFVMLAASCGTAPAERTGIETSGETTSEETTPQETTGVPSVPDFPGFISPWDEVETVHTLTYEWKDKTMEVGIHGFTSASRDDEFYLKSNVPYIQLDVKITNNMDTPMYLYIPTGCHDAAIPHNHELNVVIYDLVGHLLEENHLGMTCVWVINTWNIPAHESYEWTVYLVDAARRFNPAGDVLWDLPCEEVMEASPLYLADFTWDDPALYASGICDFFGYVSYHYYPNELYVQGTQIRMNAPIGFHMYYVAPET